MGGCALLTVPRGGKSVRWKSQPSQNGRLCTPNCAPWRQVSESDGGCVACEMSHDANLVLCVASELAAWPVEGAHGGGTAWRQSSRKRLTVRTHLEDKALLDGSLRMPKGDCADVVVPLWDAKRLAEKEPSRGHVLGCDALTLGPFAETCAVAWGDRKRMRHWMRLLS